jgi:hypothetical protein
MSFTFNITELKKHLGPGLGLRKNKYLIEIPVPTIAGETLNMLCQSAGLPERNINTTNIWHKGRRFTVRGETDFIGKYQISLVDDDKMQIRRLFDTWLKQVDNSRPDKNSSLLAASYEEIDSGLIDNLSEALRTGNIIKNTLSNQRQLLDFAIGQFDLNLSLSAPTYQTDINIWQLGGGNKKVYGYKLQNAFPESVGIVTLEDGQENQLSEFSVTFAFSEFIPIRNTYEDITRSVLGDQTVDIIDGVRQITDL